MTHRNWIATTAAALLLSGAFLPAPVRADEVKKHWWRPRIREGAVQPEDTSQEVPTHPAPPPPAPVPAQAAATPAAAPDAKSATAASPAPAPASSGAPKAVPPAVATAAVVVAATGSPGGQGAKAVPPPLPDEDLIKMTRYLREGAIGAEPNSRAYLDLIEAGHATPAQVNDFAAYLAKRGMPKIALKYQQYGVQLDPTDATLALNLGTLHQNLHQYSNAVTAFKKAIALDPNNALAHYNLGAAYDAKKDYDDAIEQYRIGLVLDPELGDARKNPQVVNNEHLLEVRLQIYRNLSGALGLPLKQMQPTPSTAQAPPPGGKK